MTALQGPAKPANPLSATARPGNRLLAIVQVLASAGYMLFTALTISEMRHTNRLTERQQALTLRPILALQEVKSDFMSPPGRPEERWMVRAIVVNMGPVPGQEVVPSTRIDSDSANVELPSPPHPFPTIAPQNGGFLSVPETISKREVLDKLHEAGAL